MRINIFSLTFIVFIVFTFPFIIFSNGYSIYKYYSLVNKSHEMTSLILEIDDYTYSKNGIRARGEYIILASHGNNSYKIATVHNSEFIEKMIVWNLNEFIWSGVDIYFERNDGNLLFEKDDYIFLSSLRKNYIYFLLSLSIWLLSFRTLIITLKSTQK